MPFDPSSVRGIRGMLGFSQNVFGRALGVSATTVHNWEHNETTPSLNTIDAIYDLCSKNQLTEVPRIYKPPSPFEQPRRT